MGSYHGLFMVDVILTKSLSNWFHVKISMHFIFQKYRNPINQKSQKSPNSQSRNLLLIMAAVEVVHISSLPIFFLFRSSSLFSALLPMMALLTTSEKWFVVSSCSRKKSSSFTDLHLVRVVIF